MSLTSTDLQEIRLLVREEVRSVVRAELKPIEARLEALENDVRDIYFMIANLQKSVAPNKSFQKLSLEEKLLKLNAELLEAAKEAGVTLPRP